MLDSDLLSYALELVENKNYEKAIPILKSLSDKGHKDASYQLSNLYEYGYHSSISDKIFGRDNKNKKEADKYFEISAIQGKQHAQIMLGRMYFDGKYKKQNYKEAFIWINMSVNNEERTSMYPYALSLLAEFYYNGWEVEKNIYRAGISRTIAEDIREICYKKGYRPIPVLRPNNLNIPDDIKAWCKDKSNIFFQTKDFPYIDMFFRYLSI